MDDVTRKVLLTVRGGDVDEPLVYTIGQRFKVITNIHGASVADGVGIVALAMTGSQDEIDKTLKFLEQKDIKIETID